MAVSEQTDSLRVLGSDPVDYLARASIFGSLIRCFNERRVDLGVLGSAHDPRRLPGARARATVIVVLIVGLIVVLMSLAWTWVFDRCFL